jgi:hypothetical protein
MVSYLTSFAVAITGNHLIQWLFLLAALRSIIQSGTHTFRIVFESLAVQRETNGLSLNSSELYLLEK